MKIPVFQLPTGKKGFKASIEEFQARLIIAALAESDGVQKQAAKLLFLQPTTIAEMIKRWKIPARRNFNNGASTEGEKTMKLGIGDLTEEQVLNLARLGAKARLAELHGEAVSLEAAFPDLRLRAPRTTKTAAEPEPAKPRKGKKPGRKGMSAAARKAVSRRMKKY